MFFPDHPLPPKFMVPDFSQFDGTGNPISHLKLYAGALCGYAHDSKLCVQLLQRSLKGSALQWFAQLNLQEIRTWPDLSNAFLTQYNCELTVDRCALMEMSQKSGESFREYALRWRESASQVHPPLTQSEHSQLFLKTCLSEYLERMCSSVGQGFTQIIAEGEMIEAGLKSGRLTERFLSRNEESSSSYVNKLRLRSQRRKRGRYQQSYL